jgi:DNA-binding GntR family transcriptional regulator
MITETPEKIFNLAFPISRSAGATAADLLRGAILEGRLTPGQRLKESALALELGISRTPVRDALRQLENEGLVVSIHNRGTFVREYSAENILEIYEIRMLLEPQAARRAAERCTQSDYEELLLSCERYERPEADTPTFNRENLSFHGQILRISGSERLASMVKTVLELPLLYKTEALDAESVRRKAQRYHRQLTEAIRNHQPDTAAELMVGHVLQSRDLVLESIRAPELQSRRRRRGGALKQA